MESLLDYLDDFLLSFPFSVVRPEVRSRLRFDLHLFVDEIDLTGGVQSLLVCGVDPMLMLFT